MRAVGLVVMAAAMGCAEPECDVEQGTEPGNLVIDGGFDQGFACWVAQQANQDGQGFELDDDHPEGASGPSVRAMPDQAGDPLRTQILSGQQFRIEGGRTYDVGFAARAAEPRDLVFFVQECCSPLIQHLFEQPQLGTEWQSYTWRFTAGQSSDLSYVDFQVGDGTAEVWIDQVFVREVEEGS